MCRWGQRRRTGDAQRRVCRDSFGVWLDLVPLGSRRLDFKAHVNIVRVLECDRVVADG